MMQSLAYVVASKKFIYASGFVLAILAVAVDQMIVSAVAVLVIVAVAASVRGGPTLETYVETRFNLLVEFINEKFSAQDVAMRAFIGSTELLIDAVKKSFEAAQLASDLRYDQRFEAQSDTLTAAFLAQQRAMEMALEAAAKSVQAALAAQKEAVIKAESATDKRFESVNEFRKTLTDQQQTFMPRSESLANWRANSDKVADLKEQIDRLMSERMGIKGGYGYAVGIIGFLLTLLTIGVLVMKFLRG